MPVIEFLRRVKELALARGATSTDLFHSACELLGGNALKWFRAGLASQNFANWEELEKELIKDFENYDYADNLLEYIKNRLQKPNERVVSFFANMEDLFLKLNRAVSEELKIKIIRRNLLPEYIKGIGCQDVRSVGQLKQQCKLIESDLVRINSRGSRSSNKNVQFSERLNSIEDYYPNYESDYDRYEHDDYNNLHRTQPKDSAYQTSNRSDVFHPRYRSRSPSPYGRFPINSFDKDMKALSIREELNKPYFSVPPPNYQSHNKDQFNYPKSYHAPRRNDNNNQLMFRRETNLGIP